MRVDNQYIHDLQAEEIQSILTQGAWLLGDQTATSSETNTNDSGEVDVALMQSAENTAGVNAFADLPYLADRVLDVGGGQFDTNKKFLEKLGVELLVWDPYNRSSTHNQAVKALVSEGVSIVTSMSVLNVVRECRARLHHITTVKSALLEKGTAYFKIWPGEGDERGTCQPTLVGNTFQANADAGRFLREIQVVFGIENVVRHATVPNLIVARKCNDDVCLDEIRACQKLSKDDLTMTSKNRFGFFTHPSEKGLNLVNGVDCNGIGCVKS